MFYKKKRFNILLTFAYDSTYKTQPYCAKYSDNEKYAILISKRQFFKTFTCSASYVTPHRKYSNDKSICEFNRKNTLYNN
jgi:hypothetical protein